MTLVKPHGSYGRRTLKDIDWESGPDRKICHNTYRETHYEYLDYEFDAIRTYPCVRFHSTTIIVALGDNQYRLNTGGWRTNTTKQRLNALLPGGIHVWQKNYEWFVPTKNGDIPFTDGMVVSI